MKLLIWSQYFWPENFLINKLAINLRDQGIEVTVLTGKPNYPAGKIFSGYKSLGIQQEDYCGIEVIRLPLFARGKGSSLRLFLNYLSFILSCYIFAPWVLRGKKFDAIFVYAPSPLLQALPAIFIACLKKARLLVWVQDVWPQALQATGFIKNSCLLRLVEWMVRYIYRYSDSILIQSEAFRPLIEKLVSDKNKIRFFPNSATDLADIVTSSSLECPIATEIAQHFSIVFAGNLGKAQACETILAAAELLREQTPIKFYLVGNGSQFDFIEELINTKKIINVVLTGQLPFEKMPAIFSAASVLLVSLKNNPGLAQTIPSKLQSYLSAGKPIIASLNGEAARLVIEAQAGIACSAENVEDLVKAVLKLYEIPSDERRQLGRNARHYFKTHFHETQQVAQLMQFFKKTTE